MKTVNYLNVEITKKEIKENVNFECSELTIRSLSKKRLGDGHYELSLAMDIDGANIVSKEVTTDTHMIDNMTDDNDKIAEEAIKIAVLFVLKDVQLEEVN